MTADTVITAAPSRTVREAFDRGAQGYDRLRRGLVPGFDDFYATAVEWLGREGTPPRRILDLGAGTGLLSAFVAEALPDAELTLVDLSEPMLAQARARFMGRHGVTYRCADYVAADWDGPYDAIVSALSIHHLEDEAKRCLFARIRDALVPGGRFVDADQIAGPVPARTQAYRRRWLDAVRRAGVAETEIAASLDRQRHDRLASVEDQLAWLNAAGFVDVDCVYKNWGFAVFGGKRGA